MENEKIKSLLKRSHLFSCLNDEQLSEIMNATRLLRLQEGERLFEIGQTAERFFLVLRGQVKLFRVSESGNEKIIEICSPGKVFAEAVMFMQHQRYPVSASALAASEICAFSNQVFLQLLHDSTELCFALLADMSMRLHIRINEIEYLTLQNATFRVVNYLCELLPERADSVQVIDLSAPKNVIASRVSVTPETFSRILHAMAREGIVGIHGKTIEVYDPQRLRRFGG